MNKLFGIIGSVLFVAAVIVGYFFSFPGADIVAIALAAFALAATVVGVVKKQKEAGTFTWKSIVVIVLAIFAGVLCCIGGVSNNVFEALAGAVVGILGIIFGILAVKKDA